MDTFLNANFVSLDDLNSIDKVIATIQHKQDINNKEKASVTGQNASTQSRMTKIVGEIRSQVESAIKSNDIDKLDSLIKTYGNLSLLQDVKKQMVEKRRLLVLKDVCISFLKIQKDISDLKNLDAISDSNYDEQLDILTDVYKRVELYYNNEEHNTAEYGQSVLSSIESYRDQLFDSLSSVITVRFKPETENALNEELKDFGTEKQKPIKSPEMKKIILNFTRLLQLQTLDPINNNPTYPKTIWAVDCICSAFKVRFVYHFEGPTETNQISKPEYALEYIFGYLKKNQELVRLTFRDIFHKYYPKILIEDSFITSVLAIARNKFIHDRSLCAKNEQLLNHLVFELQKFDRRLAEEFNYHQIMGQDEWPGLTYDLILFPRI